MSGPNIARLGPRDPAPERDFASQAHSHADAAILDAMRAHLRLQLVSADPAGPDAYTIERAEDGGRQHRIVVLGRRALLAADHLIAVGFFGQRRPDASPELLQGVDAELMAEFRDHPDVLCYCSLELPGGDWANLVLLRRADGIEHWRSSQRHAYAARELAPQFYSTVRLHNGALPGGLAAPQIALIRTKYFDYRDDGWLAVREFGGNT